MGEYDKIFAGVGPEIKAKVFKESVDNDNDNNDALNDASLSDEPVSYTEYISPVALVGKYPFEVIIEGLRNQFANYISTEDRNDYVDIFYEEYNNALKLKYEQDFPEEYTEAVNKYMDNFLAVIYELFSTKLAITLTELDDSAPTSDSVEMSIRKLYTFFILNARDTFKKIITKAVINKIDPSLDNRAFYAAVRKEIEPYSSAIVIIRPTEFLAMCGETDIINMFNTGIVSGNFLRKYTPRLYKNEEYECELIAHITSIIEYKKDLISTDDPVQKEENYAREQQNID